MWVKIAIYCTIIISTSCTHWKTQRDIKDFRTTVIKMPSKSEMIQNGKHVIDTCIQPNTPKIKLIVYYASEGCVSCNVNHLDNWEDLFRLGPRNLFSPIIIFSPNAEQYETLINSLKLQGFHFPIYIDKNNIFQQLNKKLPADTRYHIFLLDKWNNVILVGNPLSGDAMWNLFKSTLENMLAHDGEYVPEN